MMSVLKIFKLPIVRHISAALVILFIGYYFGNKIFQKKLDKVREIAHFEKGKNEQLELHNENLTIRIDSLQSVVVRLAEIEKISVSNYIKDTKVKKGATLNFSPESEAILIQEEYKKDTLIIEPKKKRSFWDKVFGRNKD